MKDIAVREFNTTDIPEMTRLIENNYINEFSECTLDWINAEIANLPFDSYTKETVRGCLWRTCLIATIKKGLFGKRNSSQMFYLKETK